MNFILTMYCQAVPDIISGITANVLRQQSPKVHNPLTEDNNIIGFIAQCKGLFQERQSEILISQLNCA